MQINKNLLNFKKNFKESQNQNNGKMKDNKNTGQNGHKILKGYNYKNNKKHNI